MRAPEILSFRMGPHGSYVGVGGLIVDDDDDAVIALALLAGAPAIACWPGNQSGHLAVTDWMSKLTWVLLYVL